MHPSYFHVQFSVPAPVQDWTAKFAILSGYATTGDIANFITGGQVNSNVTSISGGVITSGTIIGRTVQSSSGSARIVLNNADTLDFYSSNVKRGDLFGVTVSGIDGIGCAHTSSPTSP